MVNKRIESDYVIGGSYTIQFANIGPISTEQVSINLNPSEVPNSFYMELTVNGHLDSRYLVKLPNYTGREEIQL